MNRETSGFTSSDTLVVVDRSRRRRVALIAGIGLIILVALVAFFMMRSSSEDQQAAATAAHAGQVPTVTVIVPGRSDVARMVGQQNRARTYGTAGTIATSTDSSAKGIAINRAL